jgi:hypothetical protein
MLSIAFHGTNKPTHFWNEKEKIEFVRHYTDLIDQLSSMKLQQLQWNWYHHIGMAYNI